MKNLFKLLTIITLSLWFAHTSSAQQTYLPQVTTDYQAACATNSMTNTEYAAVGNANGLFQFNRFVAPGALAGTVDYFHSEQKQLEVIDMIYTPGGCNLGDGYYVTGNAVMPGATKSIFVARLDVMGMAVWYREFPISNNGTAKAITIGQISATGGNMVFITGMADTGIPLAAALTACGVTAWGPFSYASPNEPNAQTEDITFTYTSNPSVLITGQKISPASGNPSAWVFSLNAATGVPNWSNLYPIGGTGDGGTAITTVENQALITGRSYSASDMNIYTFKIDIVAGAPLWQAEYMPTNTFGEEWGEDVVFNNAGTAAVIARDGMTGNTFIHELDFATGVPIAGSEFIYPNTSSSVLRDQFVTDPATGQYFISSNTLSGGNMDFTHIWTAGMTADCQDEFPVDYFYTQSVTTEDIPMYDHAPWESKNITGVNRQLTVVDPCTTDTLPCEVTADFCYDIDVKTVSFTNSATGSGTLSYHWDFGDGNTSTSGNPTHVYAMPTSPTSNTYTVCLTVTNTMPDGTICTAHCCTEITINRPCYDNIPGPRFHYLYKNDGDVKFINPYAWLGAAYSTTWTVDGIYYSNVPSPAVYSFTPGTHTVCLEVYKPTNPNCSEKFCRTILIDEPCEFPSKPGKFGHENCLGSMDVDFSNLTNSLPAGTVITWDFGDGSTGTGANPSHSYTAYGTYMVCMTLTQGNCSKKVCHVVTVAAPNCTYSRLAQFQPATIKQDALNQGTELQVMPNPVRGNAKVVFNQVDANATILISNLEGKTVREASIQEGMRNHELNVSDLPSGMYIISLKKSDGTIISSKLIKE